MVQETPSEALDAGGEISDLVFSRPADVNKATVHNAVNGQGQSRLVSTDRQVKTFANMSSVKSK